MSDPRPPAPDHAQFDAICAGVEDWEKLPEPNTGLRAQAAWRTAQATEASQRDDESPLDEQILGGLITPW